MGGRGKRFRQLYRKQLCNCWICDPIQRTVKHRARVESTSCLAVDSELLDDEFLVDLHIDALNELNEETEEEFYQHVFEVGSRGELIRKVHMGEFSGSDLEFAREFLKKSDFNVSSG